MHFGNDEDYDQENYIIIVLKLIMRKVEIHHTFPLFILDLQMPGDVRV